MGRMGQMGRWVAGCWLLAAGPACQSNLSGPCALSAFLPLLPIPPILPILPIPSSRLQNLFRHLPEPPNVERLGEAAGRVGLAGEGPHHHHPAPPSWPGALQ